jgi:hypothetical protein
MEEYEPREISDYVKTKYEVSNELYPLLCKTPGDADLLHNYEPEDFYEYVELVVDNIAEVEPANAFKSSGKLALKSDEGYDLKLFWRAFVQVCLDKMETGPDSVIHYCNGVIETTKYLNKAGKLGVNKQQLYDKWVFDIRSVWTNESTCKVMFERHSYFKTIHFGKWTKRRNIRKSRQNARNTRKYL